MPSPSPQTNRCDSRGVFRLLNHSFVPLRLCENPLRKGCLSCVTACRGACGCGGSSGWPLECGGKRSATPLFAKGTSAARPRKSTLGSPAENRRSQSGLGTCGCDPKPPPPLSVSGDRNASLSNFPVTGTRLRKPFRRPNPRLRHGFQMPAEGLGGETGLVGMDRMSPERSVRRASRKTGRMNRPRVTRAAHPLVEPVLSSIQLPMSARGSRQTP